MFNSYKTCLVALVGTLLLVGQQAISAGYTQILIRAGRLVDVRQRQLLSDQGVWVKGNQIVAVGPWAALKNQADAAAETVDLSAYTVLPGLIDVHTHLTFDAEANDAGMTSIPREALHGVKGARQTLAAGFTSVRNLGAYGYADVALRDAIDAGDIPGPRMQVTGPFIGMTGGHCDNSYYPPELNYQEPTVANGPWEIRAMVRQVIKYGADTIKICATGGVFSKGDLPGTQEYTLEEMAAVVAEAHKLGRKVAAHAHGSSGISDAIRAGVDSIEHASLIDDAGIQLAKARGAFLVMDIYNDEYIMEQADLGRIPAENVAKEKMVAQAQRDNFSRAYKAGVRMAYGTDAGIYPHGDNAKQFAWMVRYGMPPIEALRSATIAAAELMGWQHQVGSLEPGKFADIIAVKGNPLQDIGVMKAVHFVMKAGHIYRSGQELNQE